MNFNKFQKYRAQKAAVEHASKANHHIKVKEPILAQTAPSRILARQDSSKVKLVTANQQSESYINSKAIKLRDYMYITSKSSRKQHSSKKQTPAQGKLRSSSSNSSVNLQTFRAMPSRAKYEPSNEQIFTLAKNDINSELDQVITITKRIKSQFEHIFQCEKVDNSNMVELYNIRKNLKEKVLKQLENIQGFINKNSSYCKSASIASISQKSNQQQNAQITISKSIYINQSQLKFGKKSSTYSFQI